MAVEEELSRLRAENERLGQELVEARQELDGARGELAAARQVIAALEQRVTELEQGSEDHPPPPFVKANRPKPGGETRPRKKRASHHNHARRREAPTRTVEHGFERCPECNYHLRGQSLDYSRQVIELPPPQPVEITEHRVIKRYCPHCQRWRSPKLDLTGQVLGQGRFGVRLVSLIATLRTVMRLPLELICQHLQTFHHLTISEGEIVYLLDQMTRATEGEVNGLKLEVQRSAIVHGDETGWREDGQNGFIWSFSTPGGAGGEKAVRYYEYDHSRGRSVVRRILGGEFRGRLVSDFYASYNEYGCRKQRCWVHLLRLMHKRREKHPDNQELLSWIQAVRGLYDEAKDWLAKNRSPDQEAREKVYVRLVGKVHELGLRYAQEKGHPGRALCQLVLRHEDELFQFVLVEGLASDNNLAERSIRPLVVVRKISGGSRSDSGSKTRMALASLFGTWTARGLNPFLECLNLLTRRHSPSPA